LRRRIINLGRAGIWTTRTLIADILISMRGQFLKVEFFKLILLLCFTPAWAQESPPKPQTLPPTTDAQEIVRRALEVDQHGFELSRNYTFERRVDLKVLDKKGAVKKHEVNTYDVTILYDQPYSRRIRKNDKPLTNEEESREKEKLDKFVAERQNESPAERDKRLAKQEKERDEARAFVRDVVNAYNFRVVAEEAVDGYAAYVVDAEPRPDFHPTQPHADILPKLRGKMWICKQDYGWIKLEAETLDTISWGLFILRIHNGTEFHLEQMRVNDEIWLPRRMSLNASARIGLFSNAAFDWESTFSDYKKFTSNTRILPGTATVDPPANPHQ
jgi:hypothetical protein